MNRVGVGVGFGVGLTADLVLIFTLVSRHFGTLTTGTLFSSPGVSS